MLQKPWVPSRAVVISVLVVFAAALATYWALQPRPPEIHKTNLNHLSASGLFDRYVENESAAHALWGDGSQRLAVTGTVAGTNEKEGEVSVDFRHERRPVIAARSFLVKVSWARGARLRAGAKVTVVCERATWLGDGPVLLIDCELWPRAKLSS